MNKKYFLILFILFAATAGGQTGGKNPHGAIKWDCKSCHGTASWHELKKPMDFKHEETGFLLFGAHQFVNCVSCHQSLKFAEVGTACADCHTDVHRGQFGITCQNCHTSTDWRNQQEVLQLHSSRGFPLVGVHAIADCQACHVNDQYNEFSGTPVDCRGCHLSDFSQSINPNHQQANFSLDCQSCHQPAAFKWQNTTYIHIQSFQLRGAHTRTDCNNCHVSTYAGTPAECYSCHSEAFRNSTSPPHVLLGFSQNCAICHTEGRWEDGAFDHIQASGFELRGAHTNISCNDCHVNNQFSGLPRDCFGCHQGDYNGVTSPNHVTGQFPTDCMMCHNENVWQPADFDHNQTAFPLTGAHQTITCESCHEGGQFIALPTDCFSCHEGDFNSVNDPNHVQNNFSHECRECHTTTAWEPASFDHAQTQFPLTGAHVILQCLDCHSEGYSNTPADCYSCHESDYTSVNDPNHVQNNFSQDCSECHNTTAWAPATFDHNQTQFPLTGAHIILQCLDCHSSGYSGTPTECFACHETAYNTTTNPNHALQYHHQSQPRCSRIPYRLPAVPQYLQLESNHLGSRCAIFPHLFRQTPGKVD
jgi:nitrate/TMAO reductase-like tetraheme cytochrome c subunit